MPTQPSLCASRRVQQVLRRAEVVRRGGRSLLRKEKRVSANFTDRTHVPLLSFAVSMLPHTVRHCQVQGAERSENSLVKHTPGCAAVGSMFYKLLLEAVLQRDAAEMNDQMVCACSRRLVHAEVAGAHELEGGRVDAGAVLLGGRTRRRRRPCSGSTLQPGQHRQGVRDSGSRGSSCPGRSRLGDRRRGCRTGAPRRRGSSPASTPVEGCAA